MAINIDVNENNDVTYKNPPVDRVLFPNIKEGASLEEIQAAVDAWLDEHPEATTTVQDGSILPVKLDSSNSASDGYVLSYNATTEKFEWYDIEGELDEINSELGNLKENFNQYNTEVLGLYPQMQIEDTAVASFTDGADNIPVKSLTVEIEPVQSGTGDPSPENVRPISGWTGANVSVTGKNLFHLGTSAADFTNNGIAVHINNDNTITLNGTATGQYDIQLDFSRFGNTPIRLKKQDSDYQITFSFEVDGELSGTYSVFCGYIDASDRAHQQQIPNSTKKYTLTIQKDAKQIRTWMQYTQGVVAQNAIIKIQAEYGDKATTYEPYKGNIYPIGWTTEAGAVYGGTLDVTNGVLRVDRASLNLGELTWTASGVTGGFTANTAGGIKSVGSSSIPEKWKCSALKVDSPTNVYAGSVDHAISYYSASVIQAFDSGYTEGSAFKTAMSGQTLVYELATPVTYQLTPTEVLTVLGQNNIWTDTGDISELTYRASLDGYVDDKLSASQALMELLITANRENGTTASKAYTAGELVIISGKLYEVASNIANGGTFTVGTNVIATTVAEQLSALA